MDVDSMEVKLHYGNLVMQINTLYASIDHILASDVGPKNEFFGYFRALSFDGVRYLIRGIEV